MPIAKRRFVLVISVIFYMLDAGFPFQDDGRFTKPPCRRGSHLILVKSVLTEGAFDPFTSLNAEDGESSRVKLGDVSDIKESLLSISPRRSFWIHWIRVSDLYLPSGYVKIVIEHGPVKIVSIPIHSMVIFQYFSVQYTFTRG